MDFCSVSISAADDSSHHIYIYGGHNYQENYTANYPNYTGFDNVYVLTLPAFTWTPIFQNGASPRGVHNCHMAGKRQMITVGGNITNTGTCA